MRTIAKAYTRHYTDNDQMTAHVEWSDGSRTEGATSKPLQPTGLHMTALFDRAKREGVTATHEVW